MNGELEWQDRRVKSYEYRGKYFDNISSWKNLYIRVLKHLYEDYPEVLLNLRGKSIGKKQKIDFFGDKSSLRQAHLPRMVAEDLYAETDWSNEEIYTKICTLFDICGVKEESLVITCASENYRSKEPVLERDRWQQVIIKEENPSVETQDALTDKKSDAEMPIDTDEIEKRKKFFKDWLIEHGVSSIVSLIHINNISKMGKIALNQKITENNIFLLDKASAVRMIGGRVLRCKDYLEMDVRLQKQYEDSLEYFLKFKKEEGEREEYKEEHEEEQTVPADSEGKRLEALLKEKYENGFRIHSSIDKARLKLFYSEKYGEELKTEDAHIVEELKNVGMVREDRIYARRDDVRNRLIEEIYENVWGIFENGSSCVYTEMVYQKYQIELMNTIKIYDANVLGEILIEMSEGKLRKTQALICLSGKRTNVDEDILRVLKESSYVLESFLYKYSRKFRLLHAGFSASGFFGAAVRMESSFCDYRELITDALAHSEEWSDKNSALQFLVDSGYQKKKSYSDIEKVIHEAKLLREKLRAEQD